MTSPKDSLLNDTLRMSDVARLWSLDRHDSLECISARFFHHRYVPHTHDTYVIGIYVEGCQNLQLRGEGLYSKPGDICFVNPGDVHGGEPFGGHYGYRMFYPSIDLVKNIASDVFEKPVLEPPKFRERLVEDWYAFQLLLGAHSLFETDHQKLAADEAFCEALRYLLQLNSDAPGYSRTGAYEKKAIDDAVDYIDANFEKAIDLETLAGVAGLSRSYFIRSFKKMRGLAPHAFLTDRRIREARKLLKRPGTLVDIAAKCGFYDQSHLNREFKTRTGVSPGQFQLPNQGTFIQDRKLEYP
ncbi:MAG: AraC family transcriptional regulator [Hyphomicrobiales bacterium]|nr:MAG: AraC family transcriptional regulator [Hyphomicrobiales bacterium]